MSSKLLIVVGAVVFILVAGIGGFLFIGTSLAGGAFLPVPERVINLSGEGGHGATPSRRNSISSSQDASPLSKTVLPSCWLAKPAPTSSPPRAKTSSKRTSPRWLEKLSSLT